MKRRLLKVGLVIGALGAAGFLVAASGIIPLRASAGHFAVTEWVLQFGKRRSIATHTLGKEVPGLDDPALVMKGAGAYETGCRPCHGDPDLRQPRVARAMLPPPPYLGTSVARWDPEELFYIVKHGLKFTGMPAWPSQHRDDEVRAVVAFLLALPRLDGEGYRRLVYGEAPTGPLAPPLDLGAEGVPGAVATVCGRCHGVDGQGRGAGVFPKLAGQRRVYLLNALRAYAGDQRHSGMMQPIAAGLRPQEMEALADYYARLPATPVASAADPALERGREIATRGIPSRRVPSCADCHGPAPRRKNAAYPRLAGQHAGYLALQLELFKREQRGGSPYAHLMKPVASRLSADEMLDVARYYASLPPESTP